MREKIERLLDGIIKLFGIIAGILFMAMALIVTYNVIMRYFVGRPPVWAIESTEYIMVFATFLAAAWVLKQEGHVRIDILVVRLPRKGQYILSLVASFLGVVACGLLAWYGTEATYSLFSRGVIMMKMMPWPKWILVAPIPLGILLTMLQFLRRLFNLLEQREARE